MIEKITGILDSPTPIIGTIFLAICLWMASSLIVGHTNVKEHSPPIRSYQDISIALNEHGELIIMDKTTEGYKVNMILSDSTTQGMFNMLAGRYFKEVK